MEEEVLQACHTFNEESTRVQRRMEEEGIPYLKLEVGPFRQATGTFQEGDVVHQLIQIYVQAIQLRIGDVIETVCPVIPISHSRKQRGGIYWSR